MPSSALFKMLRIRRKQEYIVRIPCWGDVGIAPYGSEISGSRTV